MGGRREEGREKQQVRVKERVRGGGEETNGKKDEEDEGGK